MTKPQSRDFCFSRSLCPPYSAISASSRSIFRFLALDSPGQSRHSDTVLCKSERDYCTPRFDILADSSLGTAFTTALHAIMARNTRRSIAGRSSGASRQLGRGNGAWHRKSFRPKTAETSYPSRQKNWIRLIRCSWARQASWDVGCKIRSTPFLVHAPTPCSGYASPSVNPGSISTSPNRYRSRFFWRIRTPAECQ